MDRRIIVLCFILTLGIYSGYTQSAKESAKPDKILTYKQIDTTKLNLAFFYPDSNKKGK